MASISADLLRYQHRLATRRCSATSDALLRRCIVQCDQRAFDLVTFVSAIGVLLALSGGVPASEQLDPAAWGSDHVGKPLPEYVTGDECLFCHRSDVGPSWSRNRHQLTLREPEPGSADLAALKQSSQLKVFALDVTLLQGGARSTRFLKRNPQYGRLDLLTVARDAATANGLGRFRLTDEKPRWDQVKFARACAGCHTTGVDPRTHAFAAVALDCYVCHGAVSLDHSKDTRLMYLSRKRQDPARVVTSICASCHVRTGQSKSSGLPYANNFVAGDNLFRDFQVDFSAAAIAGLNPADRHVLENVRDVAVLGKEATTCLTCHIVHKPAPRKHVRLPADRSCLTCHNATGPKKTRKPFEVHSKTCEY